MAKKHDHRCPQCKTAELLPGQDLCQACGLLQIIYGSRPSAVATDRPEPVFHAEYSPESCTCGYLYRTCYPACLDGVLVSSAERQWIVNMAASGLPFYSISEATGHTVRTVARAVHFREPAEQVLAAA